LLFAALLAQRIVCTNPIGEALTRGASPQLLLFGTFVAPIMCGKFLYAVLRLPENWLFGEWIRSDCAYLRRAFQNSCRLSTGWASLQAHQSRSAQSMTRDSAISHPDLTTAGSVLSVGTSLQLRTRSRSVKPRIETTVAQKLILSGDATVPPLAFFLGVIRKPKLNTLRKAPRPMNSSSN
jgi:hypothetical protein